MSDKVELKLFQACWHCPKIQEIVPTHCSTTVGKPQQHAMPHGLRGTQHQQPNCVDMKGFAVWYHYTHTHPHYTPSALTAAGSAASGEYPSKPSHSHGRSSTPFTGITTSQNASKDNACLRNKARARQQLGHTPCALRRSLQRSHTTGWHGTSTACSIPLLALAWCLVASSTAEMIHGQ